jgi:hypothetical protein
VTAHAAGLGALQGRPTPTPCARNDSQPGRSRGLRFRQPIALTQELNAMLLYEELVRARMRDDQRRASKERLARRLAVARRWHRLAHYADRRARRAASRG